MIVEPWDAVSWHVWVILLWGCWIMTTERRRRQAKDTLTKSALPPKLAAALGATPKTVVPGPESTTSVSIVLFHACYVT